MSQKNVIAMPVGNSPPKNRPTGPMPSFSSTLAFAAATLRKSAASRPGSGCGGVHSPAFQPAGGGDGLRQSRESSLSVDIQARTDDAPRICSLSSKRSSLTRRIRCSNCRLMTA